MSCTDLVCGTGGFNGPKPGDPDNNSVLSATPAYGGVDLTWTYPLVNPFAVSHVNVFRGTTDNPDLAVRRNIASGTYYYDKIPSDEIREYFYWIQFVSSNGTYADWIGPVSATPKASISEVLAQLSGKINESVLSQALQDKLGEITLLKTSLDAEINARLLGGAAMAEALTAVQSETAQALTFFSDEITQRTTADEALLNSVNVLAVGMGDNAAAIANEAMVRATDMSAVATQISTVQTTLNGQIVGVETTMGAAVQNLEQTADALGAQYTVKLTADGLVGGFGAYNDGTTVQAGFDVDTFWVGRTQADKLKPFVVDGDTVFLSNTVVPTIESNNYEAGVSGWKIRKEGPAEFQEVIVRGHVDALSGTFAGALSGATGTFAGALTAATGSFAGELMAGTVDMTKLIGVTNYYGPGTYTLTVPDSMTSLRVTLIGGGGGGGGSVRPPNVNNYTYNAGTGGGSGGITVVTFNGLTPGATYILTVGSGGTAGGLEVSGGFGGSTSITGLTSVTGGAGGGAGFTSNSFELNPGGAGGSPGGTAGGSMSRVYYPDLYFVASSVTGGAGGSTVYGSGGTCPKANYPRSTLSGDVVSANGGSGSGYGSGGAGGAGYGSGGTGAPGRAIIEFFNPSGVVVRAEWNNLISALQRQGIQTV